LTVANAIWPSFETCTFEPSAVYGLETLTTSGSLATFLSSPSIAVFTAGAS